MRRFSSCSLLLAALALTGSARADDLADEADLKFRIGAEAFQRADYKGALEKFLESNRLVPNRNVTYNVARCYEELKQFPEAYRYFVLALAGETDAAGRARIERALADIRQHIAVLEIESEPAGATLYVDRRDLGARGNAPLALGVKPGKYMVMAELPGFYPAQIEVESLGAGQNRRVALKLEPILGKVFIGDSARDASVRVDDATRPPECVAPCELTLAPGRHRLFLERRGYGQAELEVDVRAKQET